MGGFKRLKQKKDNTLGNYCMILCVIFSSNFCDKWQRISSWMFYQYMFVFTFQIIWNSVAHTLVIFDSYSYWFKGSAYSSLMELLFSLNTLFTVHTLLYIIRTECFQLLFMRTNFEFPLLYTTGSVTFVSFHDFPNCLLFILD